MQIVIEIPEEVYKQIKDSSTIFRDDEKMCYEAVQNGISLDDFLDKAYDELDNCDYGNSYIIIDGETYRTDIGYAFEGIELFINYLKKRWCKNES